MAQVSQNISKILFLYFQINIIDPPVEYYQLPTDNLFLYILKLDYFYISADITVDRRRTYQKNIGFGGAFTGSVSNIIEMLPKALQNHIYK